HVALAEGRNGDAEELAGDALAAGGEGLQDVDRGSLIELATLLVELGRPTDAIVEAAQERPASPWHQVAGAVARGELQVAADRLAELLVPPVEARVRLLAARQLAAEGRRAEADEQLRKALAFYRSV